MIRSNKIQLGSFLIIDMTATKKVVNPLSPIKILHQPKVLTFIVATTTSVRQNTKSIDAINTKSQFLGLPVVLLFFITRSITKKDFDYRSL